jgi:AGCS family alanine or glycine:cation symporter
VTGVPGLTMLGAAVASAGEGVDDWIESIVSPIAGSLSSAIFYEASIFGLGLPLIVVWLILGSLVSTLYLRFVNLRGFAQGFRIIRGDYRDRSAPGEVSHFQALTSAVSGTVGLGNIAGVAIAITIGGPGATFWMIVAGLFGMSSKFVECTLGVIYRRENPDGTVSGGPMYYLRRGIAENYPRLASLGRLLAAIFAICTVIGAVGSGAMFQANQTYAQLVIVTGGETGALAGHGWLFGLFMAVLTGVVVIGGITRIGGVTAKLVPAMAALYIVACLVVLATHADRLPAAFAAILSGAFTAEGVHGGVIGAMIAGIRRAYFSNEAGLGSAAIAHSAVQTREPITEGYVALWEPFIDTVVICTMTALVIIITGQHTVGGADGVQLTSAAFATVIGWFPYVLAVVVFLFAYSTMITWAYYGLKAAGYLFGESRFVRFAFMTIFLALAVIGCTMPILGLVQLADGLLFLMAIPNLIGVYLLLPVVRRRLLDYEKRLADGSIVRRERAEIALSIAE